MEKKYNSTSSPRSAVDVLRLLKLNAPIKLNNVTNFTKTEIYENRKLLSHHGYFAIRLFLPNISNALMVINMLGIFLDIETTGLDPLVHTVLEIAFKVIDMHTGEAVASYESIVSQPKSIWEKRDLMSTKINGFTWEKVQTGKEECVVCSEIIELFSEINIHRNNAFFICQNPAFDRNFFGKLINVNVQEELQWPYHWLDLASMDWALRMKEYHLHHKPIPSVMSLSKNAIAERFKLPPEAIPHTAINGVNHLLLCYKHVVGFE